VNAAVALGLALLAALVLTPIAAAVAKRFGVVDRPGPLKVQHVAIPYLGGVAVFFAAAGPIAYVRPALLVPLGLAGALGLVDDIADIRAGIRLLAEIGVGLVAGAVIDSPLPQPLGILVTAALVVGLINAVNLIDGLDALASGVAAASALGFVALGGPARPIAAALGGALIGFLAYNRPPARIYLGDSGAYLVGAALACCTAMVLDDPGGASGWAAIPLLVALPLLDTAIAILRRRRSGRPLFTGDRSHVYDQMVDRGRSRVQVVVALIAAQFALTGLGVLTANLAASIALPAAAAVLGAVIVMVLRAGFLDPDRAAARSNV
jgi:UDP-GlcNAc:undecaprenyl-phosphate GlcNAc-1-phosphate transferase